MATSKNNVQPWAIWSIWKALQGLYGATVTVPDADLSNKWVLITGANNGIGREAAIKFASSGANVILACRQPPSYEIHPEQVVEECKAAAQKRKPQAVKPSVIEWWECDMTSLTSVTALANRWLATNRPLDILANNAGMGGELGPPVLTTDGFELIHQVNFLSHTLLTLLLIRSIAKAKSPRIICTTSCLHYCGQFDLLNVNSGKGAYANNKLYFQIWLSELQLRLLAQPGYEHIIVHGLHPGFAKTGIFRPGSSKGDPLHWVMIRLTGWVGIDSKQGSLAIYNAATAPDFGLREDDGDDGADDDEFRGGARYFNRIWEDEPSPYTRDATSRKEVWDFVVDELESSKMLSVAEDVEKAILI